MDSLKYLDDEFSLIKHYVVCHRKKLPWWKKSPLLRSISRTGGVIQGKESDTGVPLGS